jgi:hypothetical protein
MQDISFPVRLTNRIRPRREHASRQNCRLLLGAAVVLVVFINLLFLKRAEPLTQAMITGEGMLLSNASP